ncbi:MAG: DHH family phosphoesterase [Planctomycetes bacterium]|nr:DHH family phosphoesterase [Planctomycetota bacterium]MCB9905632.1 DHH family phosphoesterase [Planctomycetota bacterium]
MDRTTDRPPTPAERAALELLERGNRFLLTGHMRPDGDCIGAQAALSRVLMAAGKQVSIWNPDPPESQFDYLAREVDYRAWKPGDQLPAHDVTVLLDCAELSRCGELAPILAGMDTAKLVVDHHVHVGEAWWDAAYVDVTASATGLLVHRIARALGVALDKTAAEGVFTSIVTDTGWFKYSNTDAETLRVAGELLETGMDASLVYQAIYQRKSRKHPPEIGAILSTTQYFADDRLALIHSPTTASVDGDDALDILRAVKTVEVVLFVREQEGGTCKLSARSKSDLYDVSALAREFGGGGHRRAAGATIEGNLASVSKRLIAAGEALISEAGRTGKVG